MTTTSQLKGSQNYIWSLVDVLGEGATGAVYKARHKKTGELYAVKVFNSMGHMRPRQVQMREFDVLKKLKHENIVRLLHIEQESSSSNEVLVMELCTEGSLYSILDDPENACGMPEKEFFSVLHDVAAGMKHLNDLGIVHRDIKPGNIMKYIGEDGKAVFKLIDFGAARELEDEEQFMSLYGTEEYLHPDMYERAVLRRPVGKQFSATVDLWSLGVTLYHVAAGQLPFRPFGGRRNRETMYKITTEKESGVISGVQSFDGGPIEWKRDLPNSCRFSRGAKNLVVPVLAGLLECDPRKMWTFEQFFEETNKILKKKIVFVFNLCTGSHIHIFIEPDHRFSKFQELIAEQADIPATNQYLLFENMQFTDFIDQMELAENYPQTKETSPVFLYYTESIDSLSLQQPEIPHFPAINTSVQLDADVVLAKTCAGNVHHIRRTVEDMILKQQLISKAAKMYIVVLTRNLLQVQGYVTQFHNLIEEMGKRVEQFVTSHRMNMSMVEILKTHVDGVFREWTDDWMELELLSRHHHDTFTTLSQDAQMMKSKVEDYVDKIVHRRQLCKRWLNRQGCKDEDNCMEKIEIHAKAVRQTLRDFRRNKSMKRLSYNEEQLHKFEKSKLNMYVSKALSLVQSHCCHNLQVVYASFQDWYCKASDMRRSTENYEQKISELVEKQDTFREILDQAQKSHQEKFQIILSKLGKPDSGFVKFPVSSHEAKPSTVINGTGEVNSMGRTTVQKHPFKASQNRDFSKELMKELNSSLKALQAQTEETKNAVQENTDLLESMRSMEFPSITLLDDELPGI